MTDDPKKVVWAVLGVLLLLGLSDGLATWYGLTYLGMHETNQTWAEFINSNPSLALILWPATTWLLALLAVAVLYALVDRLDARRPRTLIYTMLTVPVLVWYAVLVWDASVKYVLSP